MDKQFEKTVDIELYRRDINSAPCVKMWSEARELLQRSIADYLKELSGEVPEKKH